MNCDVPEVGVARKVETFLEAKRPSERRALCFLVPARGVEPPTFALRMRCSTN